jgi:hypothetical protein
MTNSHSKTSCKLLALVLAAALVGCAGRAEEPIPDPECNPGSRDVRIMLTPASVTEIDSAKSAEWGVANCVAIPNPGDYGNEGHMWCCEKVTQ